MKWAKELNRVFSKEEIQMEKNAHKENENHNHIKIPLHSFRMTLIKNTNNKYW
jgi:hypothetical protein